MKSNIEDLLNSGIKQLVPYEPGKPIEDVEKDLGIKNIIKLASNENPLGPSPKALQAIKTSLRDLNRYPDGNGSRLKECLSKEHKVNADSITLGNGSNDIIEFITRCFLSKEDNAIFSQHAFAVYPLVIQSMGAEGVEVPATNWGHDLQLMKDSINKKTRIIFIANPNNPTGTFLEKPELIKFLEEIPENILVLLDQAYFDYSNYEKEDIQLSLTESFPNLIISRTFSKAYGLAGLRIGYSVSSKKISDYFNRIRQPFNVNSLALKAAEYALKDKEHLLNSLELNKLEKEGLYKFLDSIGYESIESYANFICFDCKQNSKDLFMKLLQKGVIARPMEVYNMPNHLRVTIGLVEENKFFKDKLLSIIKE